MGFTHYWELPKTPIEVPKWNSFIKDFETILPNFVDVLDTNGDQKLSYDGEEIFFNGIGEESHETFSIDRTPRVREHQIDDSDKEFGFCKTARKSYDIAVCSALIIAKKHFGTDIDVSSDGDNEDWVEAKELCQNVLGYGNLDMGDYHQVEDGSYKAKSPETIGQILDNVVAQEPKADQDAIRKILVELAKSELSIDDAVEKINQEINQ